MAVFQEREIADDDLAVVRRHLRREGATAAAKQAVEGIKQELVGHPAPGHFKCDDLGRSSKAGHRLKIY